MHPTGETWILLGASRGLGFQFAQKALVEKACTQMILFSRKIEQASFPSNISLEKVSVDFTAESDWENILEKIFSKSPQRIFYFAGGGPHGFYEDKAWKDHMWSYRLNFLFPAYLLRQALTKPYLKQLLFVGSAIAESQRDTKAASYSAGKHALKGLITTVQEENRLKKSHLDLRLFSPGYMDTSLLPMDAWPRQQAGKVLSLNTACDRLWSWIQDRNDANTHLVFPA